MEDMEINTSKRLEHFKTGIFTALNEKRDELAAKGGKVYNFFVGTPDFPVFPHIKQTFLEAAKDPENYHYSLHDLPEMEGTLYNRSYRFLLLMEKPRPRVS